MSQSSDVASDRQFDELLSRAAQCAANCEPGHGVALASRDSTRAFAYVEDAAGARIEVYDLTDTEKVG
jgi:hypothetical protein